MFTQTESRMILSVLPEEFDSHDFIRVGALLATFSFLELLREYHGNFTTIDAQIGQFLNRQAENNNLPIQKVGVHNSETIVGTDSECAVWRKTC